MIQYQHRLAAAESPANGLFAIKFSVIEGGWTYSESGSGTLTVDTPILEKGSANEDITITYTADTDLQGLVLSITIESGLILTSLTDERGDGQVTGDGVIGGSNNELSISGNTITWTRREKKIANGDPFETTINNVAISESTKPYAITATVNGQPITDADDTAEIVVVGIGEDVDFEIVNLDNGNRIGSPIYPARSMQQIGFKFSLTNTSIEADGQVSFELPRDWSEPTIVDDKGMVKKGKTAIGIVEEGALKPKTTADDPATPDDSKLVDHLVLSTSDRTVTVDVKHKLAQGGSITIQYGDIYDDEDGDEQKREVMIQADATGDEDEEITAEFKAAGDHDTYDLEPVEVEVTNIADGAGSAMMNETEVNAGSTTNEIVVTFTAKGTMDGGAVSLELPDDDWGAMQDDELKLNYIEVSGPRNALDEDDPFEIMDDGLKVIANLDEFEEGDRLTFTYGGGTGDRANRGAVAQTALGEVPFIIESDGDGNGDFDPVTGDEPPASKSRRVDWPSLQR